MIEGLNRDLQSCQYKSDLEIFLKSLLNYKMEDFENQKEDEVYLDFALSLRQKIFSLVLARGDVGESFYLASYFVFAPLEGKITPSSDLENFVQTSQNYFLQEGLGEIENLMLLELGVLCFILNGQAREGIKRYIQGISHLEMHLGAMGKASEFIRQAFPKMGITMEIFLESVSELLSPDYYMALSKVRARSILNWQLHCFWNVSSFFNHRSWLLLYPLWKELFYRFLNSSKTEDLDHAMYMQFFIYHMCGNSYSSQEQWRAFAQEIDQVACKYYETFGRGLSVERSNSPKEKKIIAILRDRIVENSPFKVEYSFLAQILKNEEFQKRYEIRIYLMSLLEKSENSQSAIEKYKKLGIEIFDAGESCNAKGFYNSHLQKALLLCEKMQQDGVDVLISPNNGYGISDFLLSVRTAPLQIFWSHGNFVYDVPNIDIKMTHICGQSSHVVHEGVEFVGIPVVMQEEFYNPFIPQEVIDQYRAKYPQDKRILGTIGRLTKIDSLPYLQVLVELMREFPDTIYLACGSGNFDEIELKLKKILGEEYADFRQRFYFCGYVNSAIYGHLIDFWPDSFPMEQGESRIEYVAKGKLSLVLAKTKVPNEWKNMANTIEEYKQKASYLLSLSEKEKQSLIDEIMGGLERYNCRKEQMGIENFCEILK